MPATDPRPTLEQAVQLDREGEGRLTQEGPALVWRPLDGAGRPWQWVYRTAAVARAALSNARAHCHLNPSEAA